MDKLIIITEKQQKILNDLFERLGITAQDLIEVKNSKEKIETLEAKNDLLEHRIEVIEKSLKVVSDTLSDLITNKMNEEINSTMDWSGVNE